MLSHAEKRHVPRQFFNTVQTMILSQVLFILSFSVGGRMRLRSEQYFKKITVATGDK